ncbi:WecB/TagA/CpsF family glycosyl transferase [Hyphomicrobium denitrificans 1NES1]|uniref:WecB/TagA/CpsF family glycosyl transferase n=1 Tax=Hyphomicrobium denitrificans 1NES1 TaxID=670307 RepID=N0B5U7_9HYPH|nr:WecB/TagA/CpsF family glycosyltransferase [Hyphomicrobium denitrificans]AGK57602.1 WecB/TagA/CpsF family glycosyl transferase [Hyphomicrobium denitrificans 1NES1]
MESVIAERGSSVDGWTINIPDQKAALDAIQFAGRSKAGFTVFTLNLDHLVKLRTNAAFRDAYRSATFVTADGAPIAHLLRRRDRRVTRTTGADLVLPLAAVCAQAKLPIFLFGSSPSTLELASEQLARHAGSELDIVGSMSPPQGFDPEGEAADEAIARIKNSGARICFVALGAPKQEIFAARAVAQGVEAGFVCIGAGLDFLARNQIRAPKLFQKTGTEWLWRLSSSPRRFALRYLQCATLLVRLVVAERILGYPTST